METVSVVIPAYHCAGTICRALDSVLGQDGLLEVLVIDDDPEGHLWPIIKQYEGDRRVRYLKNETNMGAAASRNRGVAAAKGSYVAFLDADDWWAGEKLKKQMECLKKTGAVLSCTGRELFYADGTAMGKTIPVSETITYRGLLRGNVINCSSVVAKKDVLLEFPMEHDECHEDYLTWLRILKKYGTACGISDPLLKYRVSSSGKSGNKLQSAVMTYQVYRCLGLGKIRSAWYFCCYAWNGVKKYYGRRRK